MMDNSETLTNLGRTKTNNSRCTTQKTKKMSNTDPPKTGGESARNSR